MKTNCCVYRNVLRMRRAILSCWCTQNVSKASDDVKILHRHKLSLRSYSFALPDLLLMCIKIKEEKHDIFLLLCLVLIANEIPDHVTRFILEYQISIKKKYLYISLLSTSFICDVIAFRVELLKRILYFDIFLPSFFMDMYSIEIILISFVLTSPKILNYVLWWGWLLIRTIFPHPWVVWSQTFFVYFAGRRLCMGINGNYMLDGE